MTKTAKYWLWFLGLLIVGVLSRWLPHPPNFSPLLAVALFAGVILPAPMALALPVLAAFAGDALLGFHDLTAVVYITLLALVFIGRLLPQLDRRAKTWAAWAVAGISGSVLFFVTTNMAVWWWSGMYPHTSAGLGACFLLAIPFFQNSVVSSLVFLFGFEGIRRLTAIKQTAPSMID